jgi:TonB-linked SusC/RagA family outer membrane protein
MQVSASGFAQRVTYAAKGIPLKQLFREIRKQTGYNVVWNAERLNAAKPVSVNFNNTPLEEVLAVGLSGQSLTYTIEMKTIVIRQVEAPIRKPEQAVAVVVAGKITDKYSRPLAGVNVTVKDSRSYVTSNADGVYVVAVSDDSKILIFSYVGYKSLELKANDPATKAIVMTEDIGELDQVQVLGYSTTTKRMSTGSTYTIKSEELQKNPVPNVLQALQNRVPGLSILQNTGAHGGSFGVKIRGINGFNNVDPLFVIDGVVFPAGGFNKNGGSGRSDISGSLPLISGFNPGNPTNTTGSQGIFKGGNALNYINPDDIESVDVLKDAAATAIYGSRGAYGVILITTKKGKAGKPALNVNLNRGVEVTGTRRDLLNTADYLAMRREALKNDGLSPSATDLDINGTFPEDRYTDFQEVYQGLAAASTKFNAGYSGGANGTNYAIYSTYSKTRDIQDAEGAIRDGSFRMNLNTTTADNKFSFDVSGSYSSNVNDMLHYDFTGGGGILQAPNAPPPYLENGRINWDAVTPTGVGLRNSTYRGVTNTLLGSSNFIYRPFKGFQIKATVGYNTLGGSELATMPTTVFDPRTADLSSQTTSASNNWNIRSWTVDPTASYSTGIGQKGSVSVTLGMSLGDKMVNTSFVSGRAFNSDALLNNPTLGSVVTTNLLTKQERNLGYFGLLNYNWNKKFLFDFSARYDGSTSFGPANRFGLFGSGAAAYIFTEEKWIREHLNFLSFGKLKASLGTVGGAGVPAFSYLSTYNVGRNPAGVTVTTPNLLANAALHWEKNTKMDIGMDLGFFNDRINISAGVYKNKTTDQLLGNPLSSVTGFPLVQVNTPAVLENKGLELSLITRNLQSKNFSWTTTIVFDRGSNKLVSFPDDLVMPFNSWKVGGPISTNIFYKYAGVNPQTGLYNFINRNGVQDQFTGFAFLGQPALDPNLDKTEIINLAPKYSGSVSNTFNYKSLSIGFVFSFVNKMGRNYQGQQTFLPGAYNQNTTYTSYEKRWRNPGDVASVPKLTSGSLVSIFSQTNFASSTGAYERIIFAKLQNMNISYTLPNTVAKKLHLKKLMVNLTGQNLLTISKYGSLDPENMDASAMPMLRVFNLGLNLSL